MAMHGTELTALVRRILTRTGTFLCRDAQNPERNMPAVDLGDSVPRHFKSHALRKHSWPSRRRDSDRTKRLRSDRNFWNQQQYCGHRSDLFPFSCRTRTAPRQNWKVMAKTFAVWHIANRADRNCFGRTCFTNLKILVRCNDHWFYACNVLDCARTANTAQPWGIEFENGPNRCRDLNRAGSCGRSSSSSHSDSQSNEVT